MCKAVHLGVTKKLGDVYVNDFTQGIYGIFQLQLVVSGVGRAVGGWDSNQCLQHFQQPIPPWFESRTSPSDPPGNATACASHQVGG